MLRQTMRTLEIIRPARFAVLALATLGLLAGSGAQAQTTVTCSTAVGSTNCFAQIPDGARNGAVTGLPQTYNPGTLNSVLVVPASACLSGTVGTVTAQVKIKHTWVGDLIVTLIHPNGVTSVVLLNRPNAAAPSNCSRDDVNATFADGAGTSAATACNYAIPAVGGTVAPIAALASFSGLAGAGNWTLRVQDANGGEYGYLEDWSLTLTCGAAPPVPVVSIVATTPGASFPGVNGQFTVTRVGDLTNPLTVNYTVGGTAVAGTDYTALSGTVTIGAGQATAPITVTPLLVPGANKTVVATLSALGTYTIGAPASDTVTILAAVPPTVSIVATTPNASFPGTNGQFTVTRTGPTTAALTVNYTISGTAASGTDFTPVTGSVIIPIGQSTALITVSPLLVPPFSKTVVATLTSSLTYTIGAPAADTVTILAAAVITAVPTMSPLMLMLLGGLLALAGMLVLGSGRFRG